MRVGSGVDVHAFEHGVRCGFAASRSRITADWQAIPTATPPRTR
jgi:hypothetical protein